MLKPGEFVRLLSAPCNPFLFVPTFHFQCSGVETRKIEHKSTFAFEMNRGIANRGESYPSADIFVQRTRRNCTDKRINRPTSFLDVMLVSGPGLATNMTTEPLIRHVRSSPIFYHLFYFGHEYAFMYLFSLLQVSSRGCTFCCSFV